MPEKAPIKRKLTWGCFAENSLFGSLFLVNFSVFPYNFYVFWKGTMYGYLYYENKGLERLPEDVGLFQISVFNTKNLYFFMFLEPYLRAQDRAILGKIWVILCKYREIITPEDPKDTNISSGGQEPMLKAIGHKPRMRRRICRRARKGRRQIKHLSPPQSILWIHLVSRINEKMTLKQCQHSS